MGLRQILKRVASIRDRSRTANTPNRSDDADAATPINGAYQSLAEEPEDSVADDHDSNFLGSHSGSLPSASKRASSEPRKHTGKRKPSNASKLRYNGQKHRAHSAEPRPQDYLYFGDGGTPPGRSSTSLPSHQTQSRSSSTQAGLTVPGQSTAGRDNSGFLNVGMSNSSMSSSYSAVTYGGSLQYDYAGTQAPGTDAL